MKLSQKKNCRGCRAYRTPIGHRCAWEYKTKVIDVTYYGKDGGIIPMYVLVPIEPCPKPKTFKDWSDGRIEFDKCLKLTGVIGL